MTDDTWRLLAFGAALVLYGAFALAQPDRVRAGFAGPDDTATTTGAVWHVEAERTHSIWSLTGRRRSDPPYACRVVTAFTVDGRMYSTRRPRLYDRARPQRSPERASRYCESEYTAGSGTRVVYLRADPTIASIDTRDFGDPFVPALQLAALVVGVGFIGFGVWTWRRGAAGG